MVNSFVVKKGRMAPNGLLDLELHAFQGKNYLGFMIVNSGAPGHQRLSTVPTQHVGQLEPCPEGEFDLGPLEWAGQKGDYTRLFREIKSPIWQVIMRSRAIGFHADGNRATAPGSAGCLVFRTLDDLKRFVSWQIGYGPFTKCYVDYGLGYVKVPPDLKIPARP